MYVVRAYLAYLSISIALTVWVARTLMKNGRIFLVDTFLRQRTLADSVNHLLAVGFYLINVGYVTLALKYGDEARRPGRGDRDPEHQGRPGPARPGRDALLQPLRLLANAAARHCCGTRSPRSRPSSSSSRCRPGATDSSPSIRSINRQYARTAVPMRLTASRDRSSRLFHAYVRRS